MEMYISTNFEFQGLHKWTECSIEEVNYLKNLHRHKFKCNAKISVDDTNREIEFIVLKNQILDFLFNFYEVKDNHLIINNGSCESIALNILDFMKQKYPNRKYIVEVTEDGENGSIVYC